MKSSKPTEDNLKGLIKLVGIIFLIWLSSWLIIWFYFKSWDNSAPFGDSFGAINSLFSGLALGGIIYTILLQKKELALQRAELRETREEFRIQNKTLRLQRFENTFFNLLTLHHQIVDSIDFEITVTNAGGMTTSFVNPDPILSRQIILKGRDVFKLKYEELIQFLPANPHDGFEEKYNIFWEDIQTDFGHYFRNLYRIIKLVNETEFYPLHEMEFKNGASPKIKKQTHAAVNFGTRYKYTSLVRAQLSTFELLWLLYNCVAPHGKEKFKPLVERYSLFKNLPKEKVHHQVFVSYFKHSAFESQ